MACFSSETGTLVFAILNIIMVTLSTASSVGILIFWMITALTIPRGEIDRYKAAMMFRDLAIIILWMSGSLLSLVFGSFLLNGSLKKKPEHIKAYYVYGIVKICMVLLILSVAFAAIQQAFDLTVILSIIIILSAYGSILQMLRHTYIKFEIAKEQFAHQPLNEKC